MDERVIDIDDPGCEVGLDRSMDSKLPFVFDTGIFIQLAKGAVSRGSEEVLRFFEAWGGCIRAAYWGPTTGGSMF